MAKSRDVEDLYPASPMQMAMLFEEEANPDRRTYVHQRTWGLRGPLDAAALAAAWQAVVDRHPILRTCFVWKSSDVPVQVVFRRVRFTLQQEDWTDCDDREQQRRLRRFLDDDRRRGFETRRAPLTRGALLRLAEDRHLFVWTQHHLLLDAWSYPLVLEEVFHSYQTLRRNLTVELPPRPPYRNYIAWLQRQNGSAGEAYWQDQLKDVEQATPLGIPRRGSRRQGFGAVARALPAELSSALDSFARRSRVTLNTLVEAAWSLLLGCYSGRRRVVFGAVVSGRPPSLAGADAMIGLFINTQPVPVRLDPRRQLASWLQELFDQRSEARRWEHLPLSTVRKQSAVAAGRPLFESLVSFQNMPSEEGLAAAVPELVIEEGQVVEEPGLPLILVAMPGPRTVLEAQYDRASLDAVGARRLLAHLEVLLSAMARRPDARLGELSPLTAAERQQTLVEWNDTAVPAPPVDLYQLVRRQAQAAPRAPALVEEDETLDQQIVDYGELLQRVEALAQRLRRAGVGPGELVAVVVRRGAPLAEAMLAVMAAGGVVLPLDSEHPPQRLRELLDIARPRAVVAGEDRAAVVPEELVRIAPRGDSSGSPAPELPSRLSASSGYAFFTSGSSGFPKAVVTGSAAASSFAVMTARRLGLGAGDRMLQFASPAFDVVLEEIFPPLLSGATVIFPPADPLVHLRDFEQLLARRQITVVELPAGFWERWVEDLEARGSAPPASLRCLLLGCDRPSARALEAWIQLGGPPVLSVFGLTETGVTNALQPYPGGEAENLPIGRPVDNHRLYIVGPRGRPLPPAVTGELWIAGAGLARGYRGRPAATAERFVPDPWSPTGGERIYRTGDRARWRLDGRLEFLGRLDRQLKVRGVRVEPAEVETVLTSHQQVTAGSVVPRRGAAGEVALAAFVVAADPAPDSSELRQHLGQSLPEAMVPTHWTFLDELPLTSRGKIDRRALEQRAQETTAGAEILPSRAPETPVEERLAEIWRDVLGVSELGVGDDFFALGGDSILALQITSRAHRAGLRVTTRQIFEHPTVEGLAAVATAAEDDGEAAAEQGPVTGESPLTPIQHWFFHLSSQNPHHFTMPVLLELGEPWPLGRLQAALTAIVVHHDALRSRFLFEGGGAVRQIFLPPGPQEGVPFQVFDLRGLPEEPARRQLTRLAAGLQRRLHLSRGPLFRAVVFELPGELGRRLLLVAHHLVVDVISWQVVVQDLLALLREPEAPLSAKTTSFRTWAQRLRGWAGSPAARRQVSHWLAEADPPPALPRDFEDGENTEASATTLDLSLDPQNTERLVRTLPASGHGRLEEALLAAVTEAVGAWTGESRLWVDVEGHGRSGLFDDLDLSRTVGWFATLQPLAVDLRSAAGPAERLVAARRGLDQGGQAFGAVRFLAPDEELRRRLAALPPAPVLLNYLGQITRGVDQEATEGPAPLVLAAEDVGPIQDPRERRTHLLEINVGVAGERLEVAITYSRQVHREETVGRFGKELLAALRRFAAWCVEAPPAKGLAARPQISNLSGLDEREVQALSQRLEEGQQLQDVYPLSPLQQGMLFHALYQPSAGVYLAQAVVSFPRWLDLGAFAAAWRDVLDRFEVLRTGFVWEQLEHPQQVVVRGLELPLTVEDHRRLSPEDQRLRHDALLRRDRARGFDLQRPPLMRLHLTRQGDELWQMVWTFQQMLFDGWSLPLIYRDLMMLYDGHRRRQPPALPPAPPFRRYIAWLQEQDDAEAAEYWRRTLAGVEEPTPLPRDRVGVAAEARPEGYEEQRVFWTGRRAEELRQRARRGRFTLNTLIQGAWALALASYAGVGETVFGATVAGRPAELEDVEEMVGLFINTLPVRIPTRGRQTVGAWLQELQRQQLERQRFARLPLAEIQRLAGVASGRPLFETLLVVENYPLDAVRDGLQGEASDLSAAAAQELVPEEFQTLEKSSYPLSLIAHPETEVELVLAYYRRIFDPSTVGRLGRTLTHLAESLAGDLDRSLDAVPLLPPVEAHHLLVEANDSAAVIPAAGLAEVFEAQARRTPEAPAVVCRGETYDYRWLRDRAWKLASRLQGRGVSPGSRVAVLLERSAELPVALLAVLRAGAAYVPLDPSYPARRLRWMLDDSGAALAMGRGAPPAALDGWTGGWMDLASDDADGQAGAAGAAPAPASCSADRLAYLVYTSGSTGRPKGVGVSHGGVLRLVCNTDYLQVRPEDRVAHAADPAFDAATFELWAPLLNGGTVVVLEPAATQSPESLAAALEERQVNVLFLTTALFNQVVHHRPEAFRRLRCLLFGGEAVDPLRVRRLLADAPPRRLLHVYGPTEDTTFATWHRVTAVAEHAATVPIGRPVANTAVYVVDGGGRPVPRGAPGELLLGGPGLARGYLGRPARSAQVFVPNPFSSTPGERLYRTGDRVRTNHRGELEFLGRGDRQVKLRGFRIELGEVESVLASHPAVAEVAAMVHRSEGGEGKLVAYPVLGGSTVPSAADFRAFLAERLPDYMIPALYLPLKELPLTPHGKVDRAALPVPEGQRPDVSAPYEAPQGPVEEQLAEIWQEVLQLRRIGRRDNFFELGGDSILSIQISARGQRVGLRIRPRQVFEQPTVAQLAEVVEQISTAVGDLAAAEEIGELPLLPIQRWYFERRPSRPHHFNQSLLLHPRERLPRHGLTRAVRALMVRHGALRLRFSREGDKWSQEVLPEAAVSPVWIDLTALGAAGAEEMERLNQGFQTSLDLFRGPLLRCVGYDLIPAAASPSAAAEQRLLLVVHHLAVDGVSWRILLEDLQTAYSQLLKGEEIALLPTGTSLRRWAQGLEAYAESPQLAAEAEYWRAAARSGGVPLPRDFSSPRRGAEDSSVLEELSPESTEPLLTELPRAFGCRLDEALLGLLALVLAEWSGAQQIAVTMEGHGRREELLPNADLSRTVGWFTALYPLVVDLTGAEDESAAVVAAKEASRRVPGEGVGYGVLRYLRLEGGLGEAAVEELGPEVSFNYLGRLDLAVDASSPFRLAPESPGSEQAEEDRSGHLFDVTAQILEGRLQLDWAYRGEWHRSATIAALMERWVERLERLAAICRRPEAGAYTPSDFPLAELEGPQLQQILGSLSEIRSLRPKERLIEDIYPLAPAQQGMLFHSLLAPQAELYVEQLRVTLSGKVEGERLRQAWQAVMARHEVLRTSFLWHGLPRPLQVVWAEAPVPWEEEDWRQVPAAERQQRFEALMAEDRRRGFRLDRAPLMRFRLIRWEGDDYRAVWSHHHILLDGWCRGRVFLHFLEACAALRVRASVPRGDERPYRDFIAWLQAQDLQAAERYWRRRLEDFAHPTPLSVDRPVPLEGTEGSPQRAIPVSAALTADLVASCRRWGVTLAAAVHGAWALLLARYSGLRDVVVGTVVSGRPAELPGVEEMVGLFINTLPLRLAVPADATAEDWLGQVQRAQGELGQFEYSPLAEVQKWSGVTGGDPLFESIVVVQNLPPELPRTEGAGGTDRGAEEASVRPANAVADPGFELFDLDGSERTDFPLTLVAEPGERLELRFEYEAARFDDATVGRMLGHLQELLTGMVTDGRQRLWRLPLLTASERHQLLGEWSSGGGADLPPADLYQLFATSAVAAPEAPALISGDRRWSYRSLAVAAEALAGRLNRSGVGAEGRVGLITGRSPEMVLGLLGILAAGGVAVPLDPRDPPSRLSALASGAGVEVILMGEGLGLNSIADRLEASVPVVLCSLSEQDGVSEGDAGSATVPPRPAAAPHPEAAACCFFTSGSTGEPKAVLLSHAALTRFAVEMAQALELQPEDRWLQFAAPTFDVVLEELLPAWTVGAAVIQPEAQGPLAPAELERQMSEHRASLVELPAAYWQVWVDEMAAAGRRPPATLRRLVLGAEPPDLAALQRWLDWGVPVTQVFGLTETGCTSTLYPVPKGWGSSSGRAPTEAARLPVGRPLAGSRVYVLGAELEPLPEGAPGELFIGGEGLARGYGGRPAETAHRFLPDPFAAAPGARLYRTGDVACWRAGGLLDFLGRLDDQVKVRGVRIECGEIEAQLRRLPSVVAAAVVPQGESAGDRRLVAHVVFDGDEVPPMELTANLAGQLRQRLPEALVPAHFVSWPALPLTRHGKVDRRALGQAHHGRPEAASRPPRTALEKRLAEPWCAVLGVAAVGAEDNFFDSGGDSLSLIRLASQLSQTLERDIPLVDLFTYPSIAALARNLEGGGGEEVQDQARQRAEIRQGARQQARQRARRRRRAADTDSIPAGDPS